MVTPDARLPRVSGHGSDTPETRRNPSRMNPHTMSPHHMPHAVPAVRALPTLLLVAVAAAVACRAPGRSSGPASASGMAAGASAACAAPAPSTASLNDTPVSDPLVSFDSAWSIIGRTHWDTTYNGVNWKAVRDSLRPKAAAARTTGELRTVLQTLVGTLRQSHFSIIPREVSDVAASSSTRSVEDRSGSIGATLRLLDGEIVVAGLESGGAAERAGVRTGWVLESVRGCPLAPMLARIPKDMDPRRAALVGFSVAHEALAGPVGDTVLTRFRDGRDALRTVKIRRELEPGTLAKFGNLPPLNSRLEFERVRQGNKTVGVIRFNIWMPVLAAQFDAAVDSLRDTDAIVLDVRGNFGGVGGMSMGIAGHFIDSVKTIGTMKQRGVSLNFVSNPRRVDTRARAVKPYAGPLALVVDELSISTTEIFAGGLQAVGRARVFGVQTSGQALPAVTERLPNGDILYHAIADFLSPTGKPLEGDGVRPDVPAPLTRRALLDGRDPALDAAVQWAAANASMAKPKITP